MQWQKARVSMTRMVPSFYAETTDCYGTVILTVLCVATKQGPNSKGVRMTDSRVVQRTCLLAFDDQPAF